MSAFILKRFWFSVCLIKGVKSGLSSSIFVVAMTNVSKISQENQKADQSASVAGKTGFNQALFWSPQVMGNSEWGHFFE